MSKLSMGNSTKNVVVRDEDMVYQMEGRPKLSIALPIGLQHVLAMFAGNLAPVLILIGAFKGTSGELTPAHQIVMIQCAMFVSGLTTLIQLYPIRINKNYMIGASLPIVMGTSFAFVPTMQSLIGDGATIPIIFGATLVASLVEVLMGFFYKPLKKLFPPIVVGTVLVTIGVKLLNVGVDYFAGGAFYRYNADPALKAIYGSPKNLTLGFVTFGIIILLQKYGKGMWKISSILIGLICGYLLAFALGAVNIKSITDASLFAIPVPYVMPWELEFHIKPILAFAAIFIVSGLETIGNVSGITIAAFDREATPEETSGGILADALGSSVAAIFNTLPNTAFGQNAGIVSMTKVVNKWCVATGAFVLILAAFVPKVGAIFNAMPSSVLGGAVITVFAMILINGIKMIAKSGFSERNVLILGITFGLGLGLGSVHQATAQLPEFIKFIFEDTVSSVCIIAILANLAFPDKSAAATA